MPKSAMDGVTTHALWPPHVACRVEASPLPWQAAFTAYVALAGQAPDQEPVYAPPVAVPKLANVTFFMRRPLGQLIVACALATASPHSGTGPGGSDEAGDGLGGGCMDGVALAGSTAAHSKL